MKRKFKKGDRIRVGNMERTGVVLDAVTDDWLGEPYQILDIRVDGAEGTSIRVPDTNILHLDEEEP